ncbi:DUF2147 domain-containing protein [Novosphingobium sp. 1949]|uniref:DUF2147 domain-containing protein n=1 Tax=Novosphingobium organovorum TaxID=2930092 RepID=A0ABT0BF27_9SPHN|nr:DUF2147 domain-containing protein [Novosphingobium organovorum]MCJ2183376.1 DUF2147 domain-containing protein [Novosphingobium organovorum]
MPSSKSAIFTPLAAFAALTGTALAAPPALAANADSVLGSWRTPSRHGEVEISRCGASICGRLMNSDHIKTNPDLRDVNNKDESQRSRRLKGLQIVGGFTRDGDKWKNGTIYNPEDGGTYKATITPDGPDSLKLKGCIVWPLCKTQTWVRIK